MEKFNHYKDLTVRAMKDGAEEHESGEKKLNELKDEIFTGEKKGRYNKVVAATQFLLEMMPDALSENIKKALDDKDYSELPFNPEKYELKEKIGKGAVSKVHYLQAKLPGQKSYVLKIDYVKDGDVDELQQIAQEQHEEYEKIKEVYGDVNGFVLPEQSIITTDKKNKAPVIATVQEYVGDNMRDFFTEIEKDELEKLLIDNKDFRQEFTKFADITLRMANDRTGIIDLLGNKNLSVVEVDGKPHLRFIDPHNITSPVSDDQDRLERLQEALDYIQEVKNSFANDK